MKVLVYGIILNFLIIGMPAMASSLNFDDTELLTTEREQVSFSKDLFLAPATVVSFTFSGCQSVCPTSDLVMGDLVQLSKSVENEIRFLTITLDPINDNPEVLSAHRRKYGFDFDERWRWITGEPGEVISVLEKLGMNRGGLEDHLSFFLIVGAEGENTKSIWEANATSKTLLEAAQKMALESQN